MVKCVQNSLFWSMGLDRKCAGCSDEENASNIILTCIWYIDLKDGCGGMAAMCISSSRPSLPTVVVPQRRASQRSVVRVHAVQYATAQNHVLDWLVESQGASPSSLKVARVDAGQAGWGLVACQAIAPGETILSVPLPACITSDGVDEGSWSIHMAGRILGELLAGQASPCRPWLDVLPAHVPLPWLHWNDSQVAELQDADTIAEVENLRTVMQRACEEFLHHRRDAVAWALSLVHSRSFVNGHMHVWAPGIDLCNHSWTPTATVRCTHSPDACQGAAATEEIAPPQPSRPSCFELVAGEDGIRCVYMPL